MPSLKAPAQPVERRQRADALALGGDGGLDARRLLLGGAGQGPADRRGVERLAKLKKEEMVRQHAVRAKKRKMETHHKIVAAAEIESSLGRAMTKDEARTLGCIARYLWSKQCVLTEEEL